MTLSRLVLLLALQISWVHSFSPPIIINPQQISQQHQQCTALQESKQSTTPSTSTIVDIHLIESKEGMHEISFEQNAKPMYDDILEAMPWFIRKLVQKNMNNAIAELCGDDDRVTEDDMYVIIGKITPESNLQDSLDVLDRHKTLVREDVTKKVTIREDVTEEGALNAAAAEFFKSEKEETAAAATPTATAVPVPEFFKTHEAATPAVEVTKQNLEESEQPPKMPSWLSPTSSSGSTAITTIAGREIRFQQNSKLMYDKILEGHPTFAFVRRIVKSNLDDAIVDMMCNNGDGGDYNTAVMTESDMYDVIEAASPRMLLKFNMAILDEHKSS